MHYFQNEELLKECRHLRFISLFRIPIHKGLIKSCEFLLQHSHNVIVSEGKVNKLKFRCGSLDLFRMWLKNDGIVHLDIKLIIMRATDL